MPYNSPSPWGPENTPRPVMSLIVATAAVVLISALTEPMFSRILELPSMQDWFSLSWWGINNYFYWQPISYIFVQPLDSTGISLFFLLELVFNMYLLWVVGGPVQEAVGTAPFLRLYFFSTLAAGAAALFTMSLTHNYQILAGPLPPILGLLTVWTMLNPYMEVLLFFLFPIKAKWLLLGLVLSIVLVNLSHLDFTTLVFYLTPVVFAYLYATLAWGFSGPFAWSAPFDRVLTKIGDGFRKGGLKAKNISEQVGKKSKIFDIKTGKPLEDDEAFIDAMLAKISRQGEGALTYREKKRMREISEKRSKHK